MARGINGERNTRHLFQVFQHSKMTWVLIFRSSSVACCTNCLPIISGFPSPRNRGANARRNESGAGNGNVIVLRIAHAKGTQQLDSVVHPSASLAEKKVTTSQHETVVAMKGATISATRQMSKRILNLPKRLAKSMKASETKLHRHLESNRPPTVASSAPRFRTILQFASTPQIIVSSCLQHLSNVSLAFLQKTVIAGSPCARS